MSQKTHTFSVASRLEQRLRSMIAEGRLAGGERLPSVRQLTRQFGVSRNTVQAAIRGLAERGLVKSLPRQGTIILSGKKPAHATKPRRANHIGVVDLFSSFRFDDEDTESWYQGVVRGAEHILANSDYHLLKVVFLKEEPHWIQRILRRIDALSDPMAGIILYADLATDDLLSGLDARGIPWVTVGRRNLRAVHNFVAVDHLSAGQLVGWMFGRLGYQKILYLGWDAADYNRATQMPPKPDEKFLGFVQGYLEAGGAMASLSHRVCAKQSVEMARQVTGRYIDEVGVPQGVYAFTDHLALGAMRALRERGIEVPRETGIVGSMGAPSAQYSDPPLTVTHQPISEMGEQVTQLLLEMIRGDVCRVSGRFVSCELNFGGTLLLPPELRQEVEHRQAAMRSLYVRIGL